MAVWAWLAVPLSKAGIAKLVLMAVTATTTIRSSSSSLVHGTSWSSNSKLHSSTDLTRSNSKLHGSKVSLRDSARKFAACVSRDDIDLEKFGAAASEFMGKIEAFGDFTSRGVRDARANLRRVHQASVVSRIRSMRSLLMDQVRQGARRPDGGGPARSTGAEALLWSRLGIRFWVETFKAHLKQPGGSASLAEASKSGFQRSLARYLDRFSSTAFSIAFRATPEWDVIRTRTQLGCRNGVCSDEQLNEELSSFVKEVEPVLDRMTQLHKAAGLEDSRTP